MGTPALWAPQAWLPARGWVDGVLLTPGRDGCWQAVQAGVAQPPEAATVLPGPVLPGLVNAHSHAFQRAFAGLAERREAAQDDFWGWRDRMYAVANRISPAQLQAVASQLYAELLQGGYTQVLEFHYLHHQPDGRPYPEPLAMAQALAAAAQATGIGLTLLPVLYQRAGFAQPALRPDQCRFATTPAGVTAMREGIRAWGLPGVTAGVAIHSLRAAEPDAITALVQGCAGDAGPIHIHIAEQTAEVSDCLAATGRRPIEWLARHVALDARWQLVHATHATPAEMDAVAAAGAGVVICPSTEANLGDGILDLPGWLARHTITSIGSDSHVARHWPHELRALETSQRLALRQRNVAAAPEQGQPATAARLFNHSLAGGAAAAGFAAWGLVPGARADLLVLDGAAPGLLGVPVSQALDGLVFAADAPAFRQVWVAGQCRVRDGRHVQAAALAEGFVGAMQALWA
ncbi:formimidoylglutamate deiminase [Aquabacterium sp. OR-4]|uniref:formimidoylglutamate deiminase n=1 Tax=Aquabacterium sp. OR-4 TaxID=2978127 RepID=UPI0021B384E1|nr:formimidoylglutamate deiminase [Aquabacterium sp. OR-4]MDT7839011.1 formimidoylglutamate deiminase [Aquabacterium sp. OR-4]